MSLNRDVFSKKRFANGGSKKRKLTKSASKFLELTDAEIKKYRDGGYVVEEYDNGGIITGGPEVNSHYGLIGKLGYANQFRGTKDRNTVHELAAEIYGGKKGKPFVGASGSYEFGSVQNNRLRNKNFFKAAVGIDPVRGGSFDITAGSKLPIVKTRDNKVNVTPFAGFSGQSKAFNTVETEHGSYDEGKTGLTYGVGADWKHKSGLGVYGSVFGRTGIDTDQSEANMDKMNFGLDAKVGATYNFPIYDKNRKIKKIIATQKKEPNLSRPRFTAIDRTSSPSIMKNGGQVLDLTDLEIAEYKKGGYVVEEYPHGGEHKKPSAGDFTPKEEVFEWESAPKKRVVKSAPSKQQKAFNKAFKAPLKPSTLEKLETEAAKQTDKTMIHLKKEGVPINENTREEVYQRNLDMIIPYSWKSNNTGQVKQGKAPQPIWDWDNMSLSEDASERAIDIASNLPAAFKYSVVTGDFRNMPRNYNKMLNAGREAPIRPYTKNKDGSINFDQGQSYINPGAASFQERFGYGDKGKGSGSNPLDFVNDMANPVKWGTMLDDALSKGNYGDAAVVSAGLVPGLGILKGVKKGRALKKIDLTDALQKIKAKNIIDDDVLKNFLEASDDVADLSKKAPATKSEINWGKWNKEIPKNKSLMKEYEAIEATAKADGTWMKNPNGTKFKGTPEQFVQQNSKNFKKAFPKVIREDGEVVPLIHHSPKKFDFFDESKNLSGTGSNKYGKGIYTIPKPFFDKKIAKTFEELMDDTNVKNTFIDYGDNRYDLYANDVNLNKVTRKNRVPVTKDTKYEDIWTTVIPYDNQVKSAIGNNGMFDMSNRNMKAGMDGNFITRPLTPFSKNELASKPGRNMNYRKIGNEQGLRDLINKGGAQAPSPLKMNSGQTIDTPFFGTGQNPTESYKGLFAVEVDPLNPKYNWSSTVGGTSNYGKAPFDVNTGKLVKNIPLEDLNVYRKKWFSNNYKKLDKNNLEEALKNAQTQRLTEGAFKWGVRGLAADYMLNDSKGTDAVGKFLTHQDGGEVMDLTEAQIKKYRDGGYIVEEY